jgi:ABC-type amino acid transport substrate-binding protein
MVLRPLQHALDWAPFAQIEIESATAGTPAIRVNSIDVVLSSVDANIEDREELSFSSPGARNTEILSLVGS